jgi:isopenicillin N synthase-like dioxygenase
MNTVNFNSIPTLDMRLYRDGDHATRQSFISDLRHICHDVGFFYLQHHGVSPVTMDLILSLSKTFFNQSQEVKNSISIDNSPHYRGYGKLNAEVTRGIPDFKETYDLGIETLARELDDNKRYLILHGPNQWAESDELRKNNFKVTMLAYILQMQRLGFELMQAIAESLGANSTAFKNEFNPTSDDAYAMLRLLHYPPATNNELGVGPHVDAGWLVFLLQDDTGGLQVMNRAKQWIDAPPVKHNFIVNIGEMLQIWSNHYFKATPHRVINKGNKFRLSAPFFFEPNLSAAIKPIDLPPNICADTEHEPQKKHKEIIYGQHMLRIFERSFKKY